MGAPLARMLPKVIGLEFCIVRLIYCFGARHPKMLAEIFSPVAALRHIPSVDWHGKGKTKVPRVSSHKISSGWEEGGSP